VRRHVSPGELVFVPKIQYAETLLGGAVEEDDAPSITPFKAI
jgi:hypothetical protein